MASSSDCNAQNSAQLRKKKKRLTRKKRLKMQLNRELKVNPTETVVTKISKLTKRPFSPKKPTKKNAKTNQNCPEENEKDTTGWELNTNPKQKATSKISKLTKLPFSPRKPVKKDAKANKNCPKEDKANSKSKNASENGNTPKKGLERVKSMFVKKPETMGQQSKQIEKLQKKLNAAKFRYLNEKLYTESGDKSFNYFQSDQDSFKVYHEGFQDQVEKWPLNPLDKIIAYVRQCPRTSKIVDFGCGEALLAQSVPHEVASFDLVAINKHVTACNMSRVPLRIASMDVAVFCLSLMGTNMADYVIEAGRVLKNKGIMLIAEVVSRFQDPLFFVREVEKLGFCHLSTSNFKMFVIMKFMRDSSKSKTNKSNVSLELKPCVYKRR